MDHVTELASLSVTVHLDGGGLGWLLDHKLNLTLHERQDGLAALPLTVNTRCVALSPERMHTCTCMCMRMRHMHKGAVGSDEVPGCLAQPLVSPLPACPVPGLELWRLSECS